MSGEYAYVFKITGCLCVILAGAGYGYSRGLEYKRHAEELAYLNRLIWEMQGEISYTRASLTEVCRRVGRRAKKPYGAWLCSVAETMEKRGSRSLAKLWEVQVEEWLKDTVLNKEEKEELKGLGERMGYLDIHMQEETFAWYAKQLEERQNRAAKELEEKRRLCCSLGVMAGLFLAILLI